VLRNAVLLQSNMLIEEFNCLLSLRDLNKPEEVAAVVLVSTLVAVVGLLFLLMTHIVIIYW
jgi:hypothetical protein